VRTEQSSVNTTIGAEPGPYGGWPRRVGLLLGPVLLVALLVVSPPGLEPSAERLAAVLALVVVYWITEALPLPITALLGLGLAVALGAADTQAAFAGFADPTVFLLIGSFILVEALRLHGIDRRIALALMSHRWVGDSTYRTIWATGLTALVVSAWVSNSATAAMLYPAVLAVGRSSAEHLGPNGARRYQVALLLMLAYAVSLGGMITPVGTPTNLLGLGILEVATGIRVSFLAWMLVGGVIAVVLLALLFGLLLLLCRPEARTVPGQRRDAHAAALALGPWSREQRLVGGVFLIAVALWLLPGLLEIAPGVPGHYAATYRAYLPESVVALLGAGAVFLLPVSVESGRGPLRWEQMGRVDWGTVVLLGSGAALGRLAMTTGLAPAVGGAVLKAPGLQRDAILLIAGITLALVFSELASNTAAVNLIAPVLLGMTTAAGVPVTEPVVAATLGASLGFMLPVATPPNALVYGSGLVPVRDMLRVGLLLDLAGVATIALVVLLLGRWVLPAA
jgi:sodium-dependent dicarboxylate transporter 2/3/5